jgi:uncharacterized protein
MRCPTCGKKAEWKDNPMRPFCSERCKLIDFGHWVDEDYRVPTEETINENSKEQEETLEH